MGRRKRGFDWVREDVEEEAREPVERPKRGAYKRLVKASEVLALDILKVPRSVRARLPVEPNVLAEIEELASLGPEPARRRQLLVVKGLLTDLDHEAIREVLEGGGAHADRARMLERWRTRILEEGDGALGEFVAAHPGTDAQRVRAIAREARKEGPAGARAVKSLYVALRESYTG